MTDNIVVEGPWSNKEDSMSEENFESALEELLATHNQDTLGTTIAGVLEFLTARALLDGSYYLMTDDQKAITVIAVDEDATTIHKGLPEGVRSWEELIENTAEVITDRDPGDERDEPASESE
jgi:hypothetical protein